MILTVQQQHDALAAIRRSTADRRPAAILHSSVHGYPALCLEARTIRVASAFAAAGMIRTDVCHLPRGHRGEHRA